MIDCHLIGRVYFWQSEQFTGRRPPPWVWVPVAGKQAELSTPKPRCCRGILSLHGIFWTSASTFRNGKISHETPEFSLFLNKVEGLASSGLWQHCPQLPTVTTAVRLISDATSHCMCAVIFLIVKTKQNTTKTQHFSYQVFTRKAKIRDQVICFRKRRAQHIYLWKWGHFYTLKRQGLNLLHLFSLPAWTPWQLELDTLGSLWYLMCGLRVRLSLCGDFCLQLLREAGPLEQDVSVVLGLGAWGKKKSCPVRPLWLTS